MIQKPSSEVVNRRRIQFPLAALLLLASLGSSEVSAQGAHPDFIRQVMKKVRFDTARFHELPKFEEVAEQIRKEREAIRMGALGRDVMLGQSGLTESEVHAAINPTDTANIAVSAIQMVLSSGRITCPVWFTRDFGQTWKESSFITAPLHPGATIMGGGDPVLAFDADGRLYLSWIYFYFDAGNDTAFAGMFWARSDDGGETWGGIHKIALGVGAGGFPIGIANLDLFPDKQWIAVDHSSSQWRNTMYIALTELDPVEGDSRIVLRRLPNGQGEVLEDGVQVSVDGFDHVQFSSIAVDDAGVVHISWFGHRVTGSDGLYYARSEDGGASVSEPVLISPIVFDAGRFAAGASNDAITGISTDRIYPCPHIAVDRSGGETAGRLHAVWTGLGVEAHAGKGFDIYYSRSDDRGRTWAPAVRMSHDGSSIHDNQFYPSVSVSPLGDVAVTYYDTRQAQGRFVTNYVMTVSTDGGETFSPPVPANGTTTDFQTVGRMNGGFGIGEYTQVLTTSHTAIPVWADGRKGDGDLDIYVSTLPLRGSSSAPALPTHLTSLNAAISLEVAAQVDRSDRVRLIYDLRERDDVIWEVIDMRGSAIDRGELGSRPAGLHEEEIPVRLEAGAYLFVLRTAGGSMVARQVAVQ